MQLHRPDVLEEFASLDARMIVVSFAPLSRLQEWVPYFQTKFLEPSYDDLLPRVYRPETPSTAIRAGTDMVPFERTRFVADPGLSAYHAYRLGRHSVMEVYGPKIIWQYLRWAAAGKPIRRSSEDTLQRGGDFVVGRDGRLTLSYVGHDQSDRPAITDILSALRE